MIFVLANRRLVIIIFGIVGSGPVSGKCSVGGYHIGCALRPAESPELSDSSACDSEQNCAEEISKKVHDFNNTFEHQRLGRLRHDLRRCGVRNLIRVGVQQKVAMSISGHKTASVFQRYNIVDERDIMEAGQKLNEKQKSNALLEISFGQSSGIVQQKPGIPAIPRPNPCLRSFLTS